MKSITSEQLRELFRRSNCEKPFVRELFERLGIIEELDGLAYLKPEGLIEWRRDMTSEELLELRQVNGEINRRPPVGTLMSQAEWDAHRKDIHSKMLTSAASMEVSMYDHPSKTCEHDIQPRQYGGGFSCTKCGAFRLHSADRHDGSVE
jgi:hypothetical protein